MSRLLVRRSGPLRGAARVPSDLHIGQEALLWAALAEGESRLVGLSPREDHRTFAAALRAMGVPIAELPEGALVQGVGLTGLTLPPGALDAGNSSVTLELLSALLAGQRFGTRIEARGAAARHSLRTVLQPLRARGAQLAGRTQEDGDVRAPVAVAPLIDDEHLLAVEIEIPQGDPATKRALLISGLYARGVTGVSEGLLSRDHTERALLALGVPVQTLGAMTLLDTSDEPPRWGGFTWHIPGDLTLAAHLAAAALCVPNSDVTIEGVGLNRSRSSFFDALRHSGARIELTPKGDVAGNEPLADLRIQTSQLRGARALGELAQGMLDEVPAFAALVAGSRGRLALRDAGLLRTRADDTLKASAQLLRAFGAECTDYEDGFDLEASELLRGTHVKADAPVSSKLLALVLGLSADGETTIEGAEQLDALYPGLCATLMALGARIEREG